MKELKMHGKKRKHFNNLLCGSRRYQRFGTQNVLLSSDLRKSVRHNRICDLVVSKHCPFLLRPYVLGCTMGFACVLVMTLTLFTVNEAPIGKRKFY